MERQSYLIEVTELLNGHLRFNVVFYEKKKKWGQADSIAGDVLTLPVADSCSLSGILYCPASTIRSDS